MSSVSGSDPASAVAATSAADRTARARVRDAAIACFAANGVAATSLRVIAQDADVSPGLVIHHFGSKDGLRVACDQYVAELVRDRKRDAMREGPGFDPIASLRSYPQGPPLLAYLARTLIDGSPHVAELVDEMVADAAAYLAEGEASGVLTPAHDRHGRAAVLTLWSLGALVLHEHARRLLGVDLTGDPADALDYFAPALQILGEGILTDEAHRGLRDSFERARKDGS